MQNPYLEALQVGSNTYNQIMRTVQGFLQGSQQSMNIAGSLAMKMNMLLEQEEARRKQQMLQAQQLLEKTLNDTILNKLKKEQLKQTEDYRNKTLELQKDNLKFKKDNLELDKAKFLADKDYRNKYLTIQEEKINADNAKNFSLLKINQEKMMLDKAKAIASTIDKLPDYIYDEDGKKIPNPEKVKLANELLSSFGINISNQQKTIQQNIPSLKSNKEPTNVIVPKEYSNLLDNIPNLGSSNWKNMGNNRREQYITVVETTINNIKNIPDVTKRYEALQQLYAGVSHIPTLGKIVKTELNNLEFKEQLKQQTKINSTITAPDAVSASFTLGSKELDNNDASTNLNGSVFYNSKNFNETIRQNFKNHPYAFSLMSYMLKPFDVSTGTFSFIDRPLKEIFAPLDRMFGLNQKVRDKIYINSDKVFTDEIGGNRFQFNDINYVKNKASFLINKGLLPKEYKKYISLIEQYKTIKSKEPILLKDYKNDQTLTNPNYSFGNTQIRKIKLNDKLSKLEKNIADKIVNKYDNLLKEAIKNVLKVEPSLSKEQNKEILIKKALQHINKYPKFYGFRNSDEASDFFLLTYPIIIRQYATQETKY